MNFASLSTPPREDYILGPDDILDIVVYGLYPDKEIRPLRVQIMANGDLHLPLVGPVRVGGMNLLQAQVAITEAYANGVLKDPRVNVYLAEKATVSVLVMGEVTRPGAYLLPKYENDIAHALAMAGGLAEDAGSEIEVHRRIPNGLASRADRDGVRRLNAPRSRRRRPPVVQNPPLGLDENHAAALRGTESAKPSTGESDAAVAEPSNTVPENGQAVASDQTEPSPRPAAVLPVSAQIPGAATAPGAPSEISPSPFAPEMISEDDVSTLRIPMRGHTPAPVRPEDVVLRPGDVVIVPTRKNEVFYVVGKLSATNFTRFSIGARERDIGAGFVLPRDRDIDVVTAVAMAGYIDPIDSPTTVTLQRACPDGQPMLITVDLIKARYDRRENVLVWPGDIIYLNPDAPWWFRRTFDRVLPELIWAPYRRVFSTE